DRLTAAACAGPGEADDVLTQVLLARGAAPAATARHLPADEHPVARREILDALPHALDLARPFMTEQDRCEARVANLRQVGVAEPRGERPDAHLARAGRVDDQLLQARLLTE